ncbi:MAG: cyclic pyranopterin monophosphate synthase MoaC [Clostridiales bacterium]|nr:cyclic pyranopterin monophosphate synthase MoaC [Clostridiales bacterium]
MLTHINGKGEAVMVDVGDKDVTVRTAKAYARIRMKKETLDALLNSDLKKGDGLSAARIAGIMGAKKTQELIPLCHNIPIDKITVDFEKESDTVLGITVNAKCTYKTGIEMEALTGASVAALTIYDMCKAIDRGMVIEEIKLLEKTGGKSDYHYEG